MHRKDINTVRKMVDALSGLGWENAIAHLALASQVVAAHAVGANAVQHRPACERFAKKYAEAFADLLAEIMANEAAAKEAN